MRDQGEEGAAGDGGEIEVMREKSTEGEICGTIGAGEGGLNSAGFLRPLWRCKFDGEVGERFPFHKAEDPVDVFGSIFGVDGEDVAWAVSV